MHQFITQRLTLTVIMSAFLLLSACESKDNDDSSTSSSSSSGSGAYTPQIQVNNVQVHFPPPVVSTQDESIIVRGEVTDATNVTQLFINGTAVTTDNSLNTWQATVPLSAGENTLTLTQEDSSGGNSTVSILNVSRETPLIFPSAMEFDAQNNRLIIWDNVQKALVSLDLASWSKTRLSPTGSENSLITNPRDISIDPARNRALLFQSRVSEETSNVEVVAVDLSSGEQSWFTIEDDPDTTELDTALDLLAEGNTAYLADTEGVYFDKSGTRIAEPNDDTIAAIKIGIIYKVNLNDGSKSILSNYGTPNNVLAPSEIIDMASSPESALIYVIDRVKINDDESVYRLYTVDKSSGERTTLSFKDSEEKTLALSNPKSVLFDLAEQKLYVLDGNSVLNINLETETYSTLSANGTPEESEYLMLKTEDMSLVNNTIYIVDDAADYVLSIDTTTGIRSQVASDSGDNPKGKSAFSAPIDVSFDAENNLAYSLDRTFGLLTSVNFNDGSKTTLASRPETAEESATAPSIVYPLSSTMNYTKGEILILDNYNQRPGILTASLSSSAPVLLTVDLETNSVSEKLFFGSTSVALYDIALDEGAQVAYTVESNYIRKIDLSGETATSSYFSHNQHPNADYPFKGIRSLAIDHEHERLLITDIAQKAIVSVSLKDGARGQFSNAGYPIDGGPTLQLPKAIAIDRKRNRALVLDSVGDAIIAIDLETGQRETVIDNVSDSSSKLYNPQDLDIHPLFDYAIVIDDTSKSMMAVDLINNQKVTLSR